jgi:ElaB/YqjD/DUF883 family membrane-anchored ribosome-binding protein
MKNNKDAVLTPKELLDHLRSLVVETETMVADSLTEHSAEALGTLRERFGAAQERFNAVYEDAKKKVVAGARCTDATIRENPYQSLAIALGVGILLGALITPRRK